MKGAPSDFTRHQLVKHIKGGEAFLTLKEILIKIPFEKAGEVPEGLPYSIWQQLFHLRYAQLDILDFSRNPNYKTSRWPDDYWPEHQAPFDLAEWENTIQDFFKERNDFIKLILDPANDLYQPFPYGSGQNLFREALLIIEHNAYHTGQILTIMRLLNIY
jgi:uncharacterized damage-inducible protein DinB